MFKRTKVEMKPGNRMIRIGGGQHNGQWYFRLDLWKVGYRWTGKEVTPPPAQEETPPANNDLDGMGELLAKSQVASRITRTMAMRGLTEQSLVTLVGKHFNCASFDRYPLEELRRIADLVEAYPTSQSTKERTDAQIKAALEKAELMNEIREAIKQSNYSLQQAADIMQLSPGITEFICEGDAFYLPVDDLRIYCNRIVKRAQ